MIEKLKVKKETLYHSIHKGEHWAHVAYCGILYIEGHGIYAMAGGVLGVFVFLSIVVGGGND